MPKLYDIDDNGHASKHYQHSHDTVQDAMGVAQSECDSPIKWETVSASQDITITFGYAINDGNNQLIYKIIE